MEKQLSIQVPLIKVVKTSNPNDGEKLI